MDRSARLEPVRQDAGIEEISYRILKRVGICYARMAGMVSAESIKDLNARLAADPDIAAVNVQLTDTRGMVGLTTDTTTTDEIRSIAGQRSRLKLSETVSLKIVLIDNALIHGLTRQYAAMAEDGGDEQTVICESEEEAMAMLGFPGLSLEWLLATN